MTDRLKLYNGALLILGEREIATLTDEREARRSLDQVWNDNGVRRMLEMAQWKFAMRATRVDYDTGITPQWGYRRAFAKGSDWVATSAVCYDEFFRTPLLRYVDEVGYWFADVDEIFVRYVSDGPTYGMDLARWPSSFTDATKGYFAARIVGKMQGADGGKIQSVQQEAERLLRLAKNKDAMAGPTVFPAPGSWVRSRMGNGRHGRVDGGSRSNLVG